MAALFELADQEFVSLRNETDEQEAAAISDQQPAGTGTKDTSAANELHLDAFSFLSIMQRFHKNYRFDSSYVDGFVAEINRLKPSLTVKDFQDAINLYRNKIWEYKQEKRREDININPYTEIRCVLFLYDRNAFGTILNPKQKAALQGWWRDNGE